MPAADDMQSCQMQVTRTAIMNAVVVWALQQLQAQLQVWTMLVACDKLSIHQQTGWRQLIAPVHTSEPAQPA